MDLKLPPLGEGVDSGAVVTILVKEGDTITKALNAASPRAGSVVWDRKQARIAYVVPGDSS